MVVEMRLKSKWKTCSFLINCSLYLKTFGGSVVGLFRARLVVYHIYTVVEPYTDAKRVHGLNHWRSSLREISDEDIKRFMGKSK
jgi:hypothetical protein